MGVKKLTTRWFLQATVLVFLVMPNFNSARVANVVVVMPKGPRTLQMLGSISPQLLHTISDVLKPVPANVVQIPIPYYPDYGNALPVIHQKHYPTATINSAYFRSPFIRHVPPPHITTTTSYYSYPQSISPHKVSYPFSVDLHSIQPGPYDTPFIPKLKPSPVNPLHIESPPEIKFTPVNLLPPDPPSFDTIRNYVQKLKAKQKEFFDTQGFEYGLFTQPNTKPTSYHRPVELKIKPNKYKYIYEEFFPKRPSYFGHNNLHSQEEEESDSKFYYGNAEGNDSENDFKPIELDGIADPEDAHFVEQGDELLLKTKLPDTAVITPSELDAFIEFENQLGLRPSSTDDRSDHKVLQRMQNRYKRFRKTDRAGRASGDQDVEADFYDSDEGKRKFGEVDFEDVEEDVRSHDRFEPKKTYTQVRHQVMVLRKPKVKSEPKIREKVTISRTNIVYSEKGKEDEHFDHGSEESFGEFKSESKAPKKRRNKRDTSAVDLSSLEATSNNSISEHDANSDEDDFSRENEIDYENDLEYDNDEDNNHTIYLPYAQALVFQNDTDMFVLPMPEALVDPRELQGEDLLNFLDEALKNSTEFLPPEEEKMVKISPEIQNLKGEELIRFLDEAIKSSNQYLINGPGDAIELVNPPQLGDESDEEAEPTIADHVIEYETDPPRPEEIHSEVLRYTQQHKLPDAPEYEVVNFVQPLKTLLRSRKNNDFEIEFDSQDPRQLHGDELLRFLDEAIDNTTLYIPKGYNDTGPVTPYLKRAFHYVDVDTALGLAENISTEVSDYLRDRKRPTQVEPDSVVNESVFVPARRNGNNALKQANLRKDKIKQSNPAVTVYNDVIRHIKNHMSASKSNKSKKGNLFMIAVPRSIRGDNTQTIERRQDDYLFDSLRLGTVYPLPIFDINQFYPTIYPKHSGGSFELDDTKEAIEQEAERLVEEQSNKSSHKEQTSHGRRKPTKPYLRDDIADAFRDRTRFQGPHPGSHSHKNSYAVKENIRDIPQPAFKKPGPPYTAVPLPPSNLKTKLSSLNAASSQLAVRHPPPPHFPPLKKRKRTHRRPHKKPKRRPSGVRTKVRIIKR
ncbi:uncharacterized protein LOC134214342 [Armigeres subalbatus]|uniref:uncharacterized protein LOC134214342 n=1 Tax=Armigeres subalbatus TaxID=124917 RepID=UPI002ED5BBF6